MKVCEHRRIAQGRGLDRGGAAAPQVGQPRDHDAGGCEGFGSASLDGLASAARRENGRAGAGFGITAAPSHATQAISGAGSASTLNGGGACAGQRSAKILAALPTRYGAPKRDAPTASSIGATLGRISEPPLPLTA